MHTIGTAGHVDHGKSALVMALTGHNPDRLIEEKRRGMTLDLGFAPLVFDDGVRAGIVDVPGHERFLHNMLAGAAGMELLLLVVAATEGPREQTREHLQILGFLNVRKTLIVLTKSDLVDAGGRATALELTRAATNGTVAGGAPAHFVCSVSGEGIAELREAIHAALADLPARAPQAPAYLPIDRVFSLAGHGTIVTGTLMQGTVNAGDSLRLQPSGKDVRVRGLHVFGEPRTAVSGGSRVAVNLGGVDAGKIARGETLVAPREFTPTRDIAVAFTPLPSASKMLRKRTPVRAHIGSAEIPGILIFDDRPPINGETVRAQLVLHSPAAVYSGSRLVLRRMSPKDLLGGAVAEPFGADLHAGVPIESTLLSPLGASILEALRSSGARPLAADRIAAALNQRAAEVASAIADIVQRGLVVELKKPQEYVASDAAAAAFDSVERFLQDSRARTPWLAGATADEIGKSTALPEPLVARYLTLWSADGALVKAGRFWQLPGLQIEFTDPQNDALNNALQSGDPNPLLPVSFHAVLSSLQRSKVAGMVDALESMFATGALIRIGDDVYRKLQIDTARATLVQILRSTGGATLAQVRDAFGTSRRYALPLVEYFDGLGLTLRDGDLRRLRSSC